MGAALGDFIRARRDATSPEAVGLPAGARRRVPGLRRSELAGLAGISVEYLVRLEQGRDTNPSPSVIAGLATALRLDASQRSYLRHLSKLNAGCGAHLRPREDVRRPVLALLDMLEPGVAYVGNRLGDILAMTSGFAAIAPSSLVDVPRPNLTRFVFLDPDARATFPDWHRVADAVVSDLWLGPPEGRQGLFTAEMMTAAGPELARRLDSPALPDAGTWTWRHPEAGELRFEREILELPAGDAQQVVVLVPADAASAAALVDLRRASAGGLRAVH
ncbi:helix-turn-helix transcriptional regulator [Nocardioides sp. CER19]|uniref:helix-turn-helix domain-containing protein n=1 Tax=Nocardioides sp. CER19 TaxID=3038538 RepID=UPI00244AE0CE|nr:helix-turn-helix transcriptional regulator [Nocardioides sp. CER19]MDH2415936.1 helix-turn-helix transcriptional regulator [Nocardioides sp. CER19]